MTDKPKRTPKSKATAADSAPTPLDVLKTTLRGTYNLTDTQIDALIAMGVDNLDEMSDVEFDDLMEAGVPRITARQIVKAYTASTSAAPADTANADAEKPKVGDASNPDIAGALGFGSNPMMLPMLMATGGNADMLWGALKVDVLLGMYDAEEPDNLAATILRKRFGPEKVIGFKKGTRQVAVEETAQYIRDRRRGYPARTFLTVGEDTVKLYPVGVIPHDFVAEDPMVPGKPLWGDNTSTVYDDVNYNGVSHQARVMIRIMFKMNLFDPKNATERRDVMRLAREGYPALQAAYRNAGLRYDDMAAAGKLYSLRVQLGADTLTGGDDESENSFRRPYAYQQEGDEL